MNRDATRQLAETAPIEWLIEALADPLDAPGLWTDAGVFSARLLFRCPRCTTNRTHNPGPAYTVDDTSWRCGDCGHHGTVFELEQRVLADVDAITALTEIALEHEPAGLQRAS